MAVGGRFAAAQHPEPNLALTAGSDRADEQAAVHARRLDGARYVLNEFPDLEIRHHGAGNRETVQLDELGDADLARGNCWAATSELIENVSPVDFDAEWADEITLTSGQGQHVALLAGDSDGLYVIDYTARQFDPGRPFPLVTDVSAWKATIEKDSGINWEYDTEEDDDDES